MTDRAASVLLALHKLTQAEQLEVVLKVLEKPRKPTVDVPVAPLREQFLIRTAREKSFTAEQVAIDLGWMFGENSRRNGKARGDSTRVRRRLGLLAESQRDGRHSVRRYMGYDQAVEFCRVLDLDPFEAGV